MIKSLWFKMPSVWMRHEGLRVFKWNTDEVGSPAAKVAALQLYFCIAMTLDFVEMVEEGDEKVIRYVSAATFNRFRTLTGMSRASIVAGLDVLEHLEIIIRHREGKRCCYEIVGYVEGMGGWCKVPHRKISGMNGDIKPFYQFSLRKKIELYAMKFYLYVCFARDNNTPGTYASFETISQATGIPQKEIPSTYSWLIGVGLIHRVDKGDENDIDPTKKANTYHVTGARDFFRR